MGAFLIAAKTGAPLVPIAIRGSRSILRGDDWFPRRGAIWVTLFPPIHAEGVDWTVAIKLRDRAPRKSPFGLRRTRQDRRKAG